MEMEPEVAEPIIKQIPVFIPSFELIYVPVCLEHSAFSVSSKKLISEQALITKEDANISIEVRPQSKKEESDEELLLEGIN